MHHNTLNNKKFDKKIIVKGAMTENSLCHHVLDLYVKNCPDLPEELSTLESSIKLEPLSIPTTSSAATNVVAAAGHAIIGGIGNGIGGVGGTAAAAVAVGAIQAVYEGYKKISDFLQGDKTKDRTLKGLGFPDEQLVFPDNANLYDVFQKEQITQLTLAYQNICEYIRIKKNRDVLYFLGLKTFNDHEVKDYKYMAAILLAHKIESIFNSKSRLEVIHHNAHFKSVVQAFCKDPVIKATNSTDYFFQSFQTVLGNIATDFPENNYNPPICHDILIKLNNAIKTFTSNIAIAEVTVKKKIDSIKLLEKNIDEKYILSQLATIKAAVINLSDLTLCATKKSIADLQHHIKALKLAMLSFQIEKNKLLDALKKSYKSLDAKKRGEALTILFGQNDFLKSQMSELFLIDDIILELSISLPASELPAFDDLLTTSSISSSSASLSKSFIMPMQDDLDKSWIEVQKSAGDEEQNDSMLQSFVMLYLEDASVTKLPADIEQTLHHKSGGIWHTFKATCDQLLNRNKTQNTLQLQIKNTEDISAINKKTLTNTLHVLKETQGELTKAQAKIKSVEKELSKKKAALRKQKAEQKAQKEAMQRDSMLRKEFTSWLIDYETKCKKCNIFSFHFHGSIGIKRAHTLERNFTHYFADKSVTVDHFKNFVADEYCKQYLLGNMNDHSLKVYLLTFLHKLQKPSEPLLHTTHDVSLGVIKFNLPNNRSLEDLFFYEFSHHIAAVKRQLRHSR